MGRRLATLRGTFGLAGILVLAFALVGCGGNPDPYAVLDQARAANYDRFQVNFGLDVDVAAQSDPNFPDVQTPAIKMTIDPSWITAAADVTALKGYFRLAIPVDALGLGGLGMPIGLPFDSIDVEAVSDGSDVYVRSPLLPQMLQGAPIGAIEGDLTSWVRLGDVAALKALGDLMGSGMVPGAPAMPELPLPSPGDAAGLKTLITDIGGTVEYAGTETVDGVELVHLKGGLNIVKLFQSQQFMELTGMGRDQLQGIAEMEGKIGIATEIWVAKATGRLTTLRVEIKSIETPIATVVMVLRVAEPGPDITFEAPAEFTDLDLSELIGNPFPGIGVGGGGMSEATAAPAMP